MLRNEMCLINETFAVEYFFAQVKSTEFGLCQPILASLILNPRAEYRDGQNEPKGKCFCWVVDILGNVLGLYGPFPGNSEIRKHSDQSCAGTRDDDNHRTQAASGFNGAVNLSKL